MQRAKNIVKFHFCENNKNLSIALKALESNHLFTQKAMYHSHKQFNYQASILVRINYVVLKLKVDLNWQKYYNFKLS